jgi:hypothetical protein
MFYDNIYDYINNERIIKIAGAVGVGKTIATTLINYYLNEPTIVFGHKMSDLHKHFWLLEVEPTNDIRFFEHHNINLEIISKKLKRFQSLSTLGIEGKKEIDYTTLVLETETSKPIIPGTELLKIFDKIILTYQTQRSPFSNNPCSEIELPRRDIITPNFKKKVLYYDGVEYPIKDIIAQKTINDRNKKLDDLINH